MERRGIVPGRDAVSGPQGDGVNTSRETITPPAARRRRRWRAPPRGEPPPAFELPRGLIDGKRERSVTSPPHDSSSTKRKCCSARGVWSRDTAAPSSCNTQHFSQETHQQTVSGVLALRVFCPFGAAVERKEAPELLGERERERERERPREQRLIRELYKLDRDRPRKNNCIHGDQNDGFTMLVLEENRRAGRWRKTGRRDL
ncbi:hypothetical protein EYF80_033386 [Liparis tanakae]|uniref:Uncharacterized protein n=1 Tax=Liparis tanakae TaxID=230148 RepID=A0A4Z2GTJ0_9TELE|nr:hypothetical protein EYF80_033386 [Liparis tanakae]